MYSAGTAYLTVVPSFKGIEKAFADEARRFGRAVEASLGDAMRNASGKHSENGERDGDEYGKAYANKVKEHLDKAVKVKVDADTDPFTRAVRAAKEDLALLRDAKIGVDLDTAEFFAEIARIVAAVERLDGREINLKLKTNSTRILAELRAVQALQDAIERRPGALRGAADGDESAKSGADADTDSANKKLDELSAKIAALNKQKILIVATADITSALAGIATLSSAVGQASALRIEIQTTVDTTVAKAALADLGKQVANLNGKRVRLNVLVLDVPAKKAMRDLEAKVNALNGKSIKVGVTFNDAAAKAALKAFAAEVRKLDGKNIKMRVDLNSSAARAALKTLQGQLAALSGKNIKINVKINTSAAVTALTALKKLVTDLDGKTIKITIDLAGGAAVRASLTAIARACTRLDGRTVVIDIDLRGAAAAIASLTALLALARALRTTLPVLPPGGLGSGADAAGFGLSRLGAIIALVISLGSALIPIAAVMAASISAIATAATAAVAGLGVFVLGIFGVIKAVGAMQKAETEQKQAAKSNASAQNQIANALDGVRDANENLQRTREDVARGAKRAARAVVDAHRSVIEAEKDALKAEKDLLRAKQEAQRQDEDRAFSVRENALAQRQANLDIAEAKKELDKVLHNPRATKAEREEALITYEQRKLQMEELGVEGKRLAEDQERIAKEGADVVVAAQERMEQATNNVAKAQVDLADAIEEQTQQRVDGDRQIRDSQQAVIRSQRALQQAYVSSSTAGGAAMNNLKEAMDALSPAGRRFAKFLFSLKKDFKDLQTAAETGMLPGLQKAIESMVPYFPAIKDFTRRVAVALGDAFILIANTLKDPVWQTWFGYISQTAGPVLLGMTQFIMDVLTGLFGIFNALTGFNAPIGKGLLEWSAMFREWGSTLGANSHFAKFIEYVKKSAPIVLHFFGTLWETLKRIVIAAAPLGLIVLSALTTLFEWLNKIPLDVLTILLASIVGISTAFLVLGGVMLLLSAGPIALIIAGIVALGAYFALLYIKVKWYRDFINSIGDAAIWLWEKAIKPSFEAIAKFTMEKLVPAMVWLWERAIKPAWGAIVDFCKRELVPIFESFWKTAMIVFKEIGKIATVFWDYLLKPIFMAIAWTVEKILMPVFMWLWKHVLMPVFEWFGVAAKVLWAILQVIFGLIQIAVIIMAKAFMFAWDWFIKPTFDLIAAGVKWLWEKMRPFTDWLAKVWKENIGPALSSFGSFLSDVWDGIVDIFRKGVRFVVDVVLNDGILAAYNWLAKKFGVKPDDVRVNLPASFYSNGTTARAQTGGKSNTHFAGGGHVTGPGGPQDDLIQAWLSNGEYVIPARVVGKLGVGYFDQLIGKRPGRTQDARPGAMYAEGGFVGFLRSAWDKLTDPIGFLKDQAKKLFDQVPGGELVKSMVIAPAQRVVSTVIEKITGALSGGGGGGDYGPGPGFPPWPSSPGASRGDSGVWRSIVALIKSTGPLSGQFGNGYRPGDRLWHGSGRAVDWMGFNQDKLASFLSTRKPLELIHRTDSQDFAFTRGVDKGSFNERLMQEHRNHIHIAMDSGGWLMPGFSHIFNGTGSPEAVLTGKQWSTLEQNVNQGGHAERHTTYNFGGTSMDVSRFRAMENAEAVRARYDRAR